MVDPRGSSFPAAPRFGAAARIPTLGAALLVGVAGCVGEQQGSDSAGVVNVYSHRHYDIDQQLFETFTAQTGIQVNVVTAAADELVTRLENEGAQSPADVLITVDIGRLHRAKQRGLLQSVSSPVLDANIPAHLRDAEGQWFGLTQRARILVYHKGRVQPGELASYEDLAGPAWKGRVLTRSSSNVYNESLTAAMVAHLGAEGAQAWAAGIAANMAQPPSGGDADQIKAVAAGVGDVALVNTYYLARMVESVDAEERRVAEQVAPFFPNQDGRGAHINVSGAGVTASSKNRENAIRLLEFLSGDEAQRLFAEGGHEYPVKPGVAWSATLQSWGQFKADDLSLTRIGELSEQAVRLFDLAGWR